MLSTGVCTCCVTLLFLKAYTLLRPRMEGRPFESMFRHWVFILGSLLLWGPLYFVTLGFAIWKAALTVLTSSSFEYEVASKPTFSSGKAENNEYAQISNAANEN